ncbi:MAG: hypothetical protein SGARI_002147 [Bacillariaceae sp.]
MVINRAPHLKLAPDGMKITANERSSSSVTLQKGWDDVYSTKDNFIMYASSDGKDIDDPQKTTENEKLMILRTIQLATARMDSSSNSMGFADHEDFFVDKATRVKAPRSRSVIYDLTSDNIVDLTGTSDDDAKSDSEESDFNLSDDESSTKRDGGQNINNGASIDIDNQDSDAEEEFEVEYDSDDEEEEEEYIEIGDDVKEGEYDGKELVFLENDEHFTAQGEFQGPPEALISDDSQGWSLQCSPEVAFNSARVMFNAVSGSDEQQNGPKLEMKLLLLALLHNASSIKFVHYKLHFRSECEILQEWAVLVKCKGTDDEYQLHCSERGTAWD